ncbi:unnamed protein product [Rhodiola kirilowii]
MLSLMFQLAFSIQLTHLSSGRVFVCRRPQKQSQRQHTQTSLREVKGRLLLGVGNSPGW